VFSNILIYMTQIRRNVLIIVSTLMYTMYPGGPGRRRGRRWVEALPLADYYQPRAQPNAMRGEVTITIEEIEALRLVDLAGQSQEEAAASMGVSRKTLWRDLTAARRKLVEALINGWSIQIAGGSYVLRSGMNRGERRW
jgi:predicted DNA-binding protein (UPF0251 family)